MIESFHLQNFQPHKDRQFALDKYCTTFVGPTDKGKSSLIRALRWLFLNKPAGDQFIRHGQKSMSVTAVVDGHEVTRTKGAANTYTLDGREFRAFGGDVPRDIAELLNVSEDNIQRQHSPHYWLSDTPGTVSRELNRIVNLDSIDAALASIGAAVRKARADQEATQHRLAQAQERRDGLKWVSQLNRDLAEAEELYAKWYTAVQKSSRIASTVAEAEKCRNTVSGASDAATAARVVVLAGERAVKTKNKADVLAHHIEMVLQSKLSVDNCIQAATVARAELDKKMVGNCPVCKQPFPKKLK